MAKGPTKGNIYEASALNYDLNTAISALSRAMFFFVDARCFPSPRQAFIVALRRYSRGLLSREILFN